MMDVVNCLQDVWIILHSLWNFVKTLWIIYKIKRVKCQETGSRRPTVLSFQNKNKVNKNKLHIWFYHLEAVVRGCLVKCKKSVLRNLVKFTGKHLCQSLFFNKVASLAGLRPATLLKKRLCRPETCATGKIFHPDLLQIDNNLSDAGSTSLDNR